MKHGQYALQWPRSKPVTKSGIKYMKKSDIHLNHTYAAKVSGTITVVKILGESPYGGWMGRNIKTGREVRIRSAQRLRYEVK